MTELVSNSLGIPTKFLRSLYPNRLKALVTKKWLQSMIQTGSGKWNADWDITDSEVDGILASSNSVVPSPWIRIFIRVQLRQHGQGRKFEVNETGDVFHTLHGHLDDISHWIYRNTWRSFYNKYGDPVRESEGNEDESRKHTSDNAPELFALSPGDLSSPNTVPIYAIKEKGDNVFVLEKYIPHNIHNILAYSPAIINFSNAKPLFLLYQLLKTMLVFHDKGIRIGDLNIYNVLLDSKLWVYLSTLHKRRHESVEHMFKKEDNNLSFPIKEDTELNQLLSMESMQFQKYYHDLKIDIKDLPKIVDMWVKRKLTNFKYLLVLNHLAGRRLGDPNHHPVLPWVMDFSGPDTGFRDLSMSKFRLNKGDHQLDHTFGTFSVDHIPHHVPDVLSDITYYVYKARQTPKNILCTFVRSKWVPNEYPNSMQRMQEWTPDECIPEFFTDPTIFTSIHEDLQDLEIPAWCSSAQDFIQKHMDVLESDYVSEDLHHWIDLTFGYKLTGSAAVKCKNVNLKLVDDHKQVVNHGVMQLFLEPHPHRIPLSQSLKETPPRLPKNMFVYDNFGETHDEGLGDKRSAYGSDIKRPDNEPIHFPKMYDPLANLNQLESSFMFSCKSAKCIPETSQCQPIEPVDNKTDNVWRDMQSFACLACEMFFKDYVPLQDKHCSLEDRYKYLCKVYTENPTVLPRCLRVLGQQLLHLDKPETFSALTSDRGHNCLFLYPTVNALGLPPPTPSHLLHPLINIIPFPGYFPQLYECICNLRHKDYEIEQIKWNNSSQSEKEKVIKVISREKVTILQRFLEDNQGKFGVEGIELVLPYVEELFIQQDTAIQAAWSLFNLIGQELGPIETSKIFLPHLVHLFNPEQSTPKHMKIYHRSFLIQLLLRLGLSVFVHNFSTLLVEAVAGYKDYNFEELFLTLPTNQGNTTGSYKELPPLKEQLSEEEEVFQSDENDVNSGCGDVSDEEFTEDFPCIIDEDKQDGNKSSFDEDSLSSKSEVSQSQEDADKMSIHSLAALINSHQGETGSDIEDDIGEKTVQFQCQDEEEPENSPRPRSILSDQIKGSSMVRSETDEFAQTMSEKSEAEVVNIKDVATESIKWLARRLGCLLTAKYLSRNLIRMLTLCYLGDEQLIVVGDSGKKYSKTSRLVSGDRNAHKVLECLSEIAQLYGEQVVLLQYIPCTVDMVNLAKKRLTQKGEAGLISALVLLRHILPLISDKNLMDILQESVIKGIVRPTIKLVSSAIHHFPGGSTIRTVICHKLIDVIFVIGLRLGFEITKHHMTGILNEFFQSFDQVYGPQMRKSESSQSLQEVKQSSGNLGAVGSSDDSYCNIKMDSHTHEPTIGTPVSIQTLNSPQSPWTMRRSMSLGILSSIEDKEDSPDNGIKDKETVKQELTNVFSPDLAIASYIPFIRIFGNTHMEQCLPNETLIRELCSQCDINWKQGSSDSGSEPPSPSGELSTANTESNAAVTGNRIELTNSLTADIMRFGPIHRSSRILTLDPDEIKFETKERSKSRHLKGNWLAYWEHELGLSEQDSLFNFKQIKLQTFEGHTNSIRSLVALDNENSFISASKDKTVKLWSIRSFGDGGGRCKCQWTYNEHKKSIFSIVYLDSVRLVASCDSSVHIWDPFTMESVRQLDSNENSPVVAMVALPSPSTMIVTATNESILRFLDLRSGEYAHEFKTSVTSAGLIRSLTVSPDNNWIAVGFSSGLMSLLDQRTGLLMSTWKGHDGEILQVKAYDRENFVSTSFDNTIKVWNSNDTKEACTLKGHTEPVHCFTFYKGQLITATTGNKIGVHPNLNNQARIIPAKLRSDTFKGVLTSLSVLPLNRTLLLGADNGNIRLLC